MASRSDQPTHSNWDIEAEEAVTDYVPFPSISQVQDMYLSCDESLSDSEDEDDTDLYGILQLPVPTSSQEEYTPDYQATQLAAVSLPQLHINTPEATPTLSTDTDNIQQFTFPTPQLPIQYAKAKRSCNLPISSQAKRLASDNKQLANTTKTSITVTYIGEASPALPDYLPTLDPSIELPNYYEHNASKEWEKRTIFTPDLNYTSPSGLLRTDLYVYTIDANRETQSQSKLQNHSYRRALNRMHTPIERFYPQLWEDEHLLHTDHPILPLQELEVLPFYKEPYENAIRVDRTPTGRFHKVLQAIQEPTEQLHPDPPAQQHSLSPQASHLLHANEPIKFFDALLRSYEFNSILKQTKLYRKQKNKLKWKEPTYHEIRCFIGLLMWTSLVKMPNRRSYFSGTQVYNLPHFRAHTTRDRFEQLLSMLHLANNEELPHTLKQAELFEAKLGNILKAVNTNSMSLITPSRALSIDEMMVKFYGRSVLRQYIKAKPNKYGIKLWSICCACCGYSLTQNIYLGSTVDVVGGRDVVLQLSQPYLDKGHVIYCDRFFSYMDLAAYLRSRQTGMVGTSSLASLPPDLDYLVRNMHPLTWAYKWFNSKANITYHARQGPNEQLHAEEPICLLVWMDKKYRAESKKVVFITNCVPAIPTSPQIQCHRKNIRDAKYQYTKQLITSPPILKAYNHLMGGVDRHNRLVAHHAIPLSSKRGYLKVFFHILDSAIVNAWILFKTAQEARGELNEAAKRRYTLAWFKESVILSLCGNYTCRTQTSASVLGKTVLPIQSLDLITQHQIKPAKQIPGIESKLGRCVVCKKPIRTACMGCNRIYCYDCGRQHLHELIMQHSIDNTSVTEEEQQLIQSDTISLSDPIPQSDAISSPLLSSESDIETDDDI